MRLSVEHCTDYRYAEEVFRSIQYLRLTPRSSSRQRILRWELELPEKAPQGTDNFGNILHVLTLDRPHTEIHICARGEVEMPEDPEEDSDIRLSPLVYQRFTRITRADAGIKEFARGFGDKATLPLLEKLSTALLDRMPYKAGKTQVTSTSVEAFESGAGVGQDHTHVFLSCCRVLGIPARYVSGYLCESSGKLLSHAWAEVWLDSGWHTFDVTHQQHLTPRNRLKLAVGLDYMDACPVRGVRYGGGPETLSAFAVVERVRELGQ